MLLDAADERLEVQHELVGLAVVVIRDVRRRLTDVLRIALREPREEVAAVAVERLGVGDRAFDRRWSYADERAIEEPPVVVLMVRVGIALHADVGRAAAAERRADDANVQVVDSGKLGFRAGRADTTFPVTRNEALTGASVTVHVALRATAERSAVSSDLACGRRVDAVWIDEPGDEDRHRRREEVLLVTHRRGVVDREQEVDLLDNDGRGRWRVAIVPLPAVGQAAVTRYDRASAAHDQKQRRDNPLHESSSSVNMAAERRVHEEITRGRASSFPASPRADRRATW